MAVIVKMPAPRVRSFEAAAGRGGAQILFFTGVRYEREVEVEADDVEIGTPAALALAVEDASVQAAV